MLNQEFNFEDFLDMLNQMKKMGPLAKIMEMMPGMNAKELKGIDLSQGEKEMSKIEAIISSMTFEERRKPNLISASPSRKKRIANGSGTSIQEVNKILKHFDMMKKTMKNMKGMQKSMKKGLFGKLPF